MKVKFCLCGSVLAAEYESPSNLLKFSSKTNQNYQYTQATTLNSSRKLDEHDNNAEAITSMFLRTPKDKGGMTITGGTVLD